MCAVPEWSMIVIRSMGAIAMLFLITRILGKKQIAQLTYFEYVAGIAMGDLVGFISTDMQANYLHGTIALLTWFSIPLVVEFLSLRSKRLRYWLDGKGTVFIRNGKILEENLKKERYTTDELLELLRLKSVFNPADVEFAMLESSGDLSVLLKKERQPVTRSDAGYPPEEAKPGENVIADGKIQKEALARAGRDPKWLCRELAKQNLKPEDVFLAVVDNKGNLYLDLYDDQEGKKRKKGQRQSHP